jgi:PII-like signaling protein
VRNLWEGVRGFSGKGLKNDYLLYLAKNLPVAVEAIRGSANNELVNWSRRAQDKLSSTTDAIFARIRAVLTPLCDSISPNPAK